MLKISLCILVMTIVNVHATTAVIKRSLFADMNIIGGGFTPDSQSRQGHPTIISSIQIDDQPSAILFKPYPFEYCQAIRICIADKMQIDKDIPVTIKEEHCENSVDYIPPTGAITITKKGETPEKGFAIDLRFDMAIGSHQIDVSPSPYVKKSQWSATPKAVDLTSKTLIILTNSRQCHPQSFVNGKITYHPIYTQNQFDGEWPNIFQFTRFQTSESTLMTHTSPEVKKTVDYFPVVKKWTHSESKLKNIQFSCMISGEGDNNRERIVKPSVLIAPKQIQTSTAPQNSNPVSRIDFNVDDCHWLRLWFTKKAEWKDYATSIDKELDQTIDFIFNAGIVFLPDRENAVTLPGSVKQIKSFRIAYHQNNNAELLIGRTGNDYINPIFFKFPILEEGDYNIFMIRSPSCDARFSTGFGTNSGQPIHNMVTLKPCKAFSIAEPST